MKKITGYTETTEINGREYTVSIIKRGTGINAIYDSYLSHAGITVEMGGYPINQQYTDPPYLMSIDEAMELAICSADDYVSDLDRLVTIQDMFYDFMEEVDENRRIQKLIAEQAQKQ